MARLEFEDWFNEKLREGEMTEEDKAAALIGWSAAVAEYKQDKEVIPCTCGNTGGSGVNSSNKVIQ